MPSLADVLIFEDHEAEVVRIAEWLGLTPSQYVFCRKFVQTKASGRYPNEEADRGWKWVESEIRRVDPKVVVFDYLLSQELGNLSFDGLYYGTSCKSNEFWPDLGVVLVTTGGDDDMAGQIQRQKYLDQQHKEQNWAIDAAWIKPWGAAQSTISDTKVQVEFQRLIRHSRPPSKHPAAK